MDVDGLEGPFDAVVLRYTYIFTANEPVRVEPEDRFVVLVPGPVILPLLRPAGREQIKHRRCGG
jgi:hypothetical protein